MRRAARVDNNQEQIVRALRSAGCTVEILSSVGLGVPDLLVGARRSNYLLEVKDEDGTETVAQVEWAARWRGQRAIVRSSLEALRVVGVVA